ncbi:SMC family ATPase [Streptomyces sp. NPDC047023]|uniref:SMC family ATPase n=1 Tax=Streptomyces sp. NPDC047023 TaxID=3155139 RepID=UPI0034102BE6
MYLHHLTVQAFGPFARAESVDFTALAGNGLFLLRGDTGAGKTSVLDAVCFALYGTVPGIRPTHRLRSDHAPDGTRTTVTLDFSAAGRRLRIIRTPKQSRPSSRAKSGIATDEATVQVHRHTRTDDGEDHWEPVCANHQDAAKEIDAALGLSKEQFCQVVLLPQGDFATFLRADAKDRAALLRRLFDTGRFQDLQSWLSARSKDARKRLDDALAGIGQLTERIDQEARTLRQPDGGLGARPGADGPGMPEVRPGPPEARPGTPDVRPGVDDPAGILTWTRDLLTRAQDARTGARADAGQSEAEHREAKTAHQRATELAARQTRHRDALTRRTALDAQASGHAELRRQLDAGRRAQTVRHLLDGLERATAALDTARGDEQKARALLTTDHEDQDVHGLRVQLEHHHAERGRATGLLPEEQLHAQLGAQLRELTDKEEQARGVLDDTEQWLAAWPAVEGEHTASVEAMKRSADRVPHLEQTVQEFAGRHAAALLRDELAARLEVAAAEEDDRRAAALQAKQDWLDLRERRLDGMAGELATGLSAGTPCAVCGAREHPAPARPRADQPTREDEDKARALHEQADEALTSAGHERGDLATRHAQALGTAGTVPPADVATALHDARTAHTEACDTAARLPEAQEELTRLRDEHHSRTRQHQEARERLTECQTRSRTLTQRQAELTATLDAARAGHTSLEARLAALVRTAARLDGAIAATLATQDATDRHGEALAAADRGARDAGFTGRADAAAALRTPGDLNRWEAELDQWGKEAAVVTAALTDPDLVEAGAQPAADPDAAARTLQQAETRLKDTAGAVRQADDRLTALTELTQDLHTRLAGLEPLERRHALVDRLASIATANSAANTLTMELEAYVLAARLEEIAAAANTRLRTMTSDRYLLVHSDEKEAGRRGRAKAGLGLRVLDTWTGSERETSTLSGGETFTASLALALGLADVVTQEASGRPLGTLFIDEGFGTLDEQNLQDVMDVLDQLRAGNRTVGIVSHVAELGRRIPSQLDVRKQRDGSSLSTRIRADL